MVTVSKAKRLGSEGLDKYRELKKAALEADEEDWLPDLVQFAPLKGDKALFLDGYEGYFEQNKLKNPESKGSMTSAVALSHDEMLQLTQILNAFQGEHRDNLKLYYETLFAQWYANLHEGHNLAFYGLGSKRNLILRFVQDFVLPKLVARGMDTKAVVLNGYNPESTVGELMKQIGAIFYPNARDYPLNPRSAIEFIRKLLKNRESPQLVVLVNNIDGERLRSDRAQELLSRLASIPQVWMCVTMDHVNTPLMWDGGVLSQFNFLWHDVTTFDPYFIETSFKDMLSLGKSSKYVGSEGARNVLTSLAAKARELYRLLLRVQVAKMQEEVKKSKKPKEREKIIGKIKHGIALQELYERAARELITSNKVDFRAHLGEFCDHKMAVISKNTSGTEFVFIPYKLDEIEELCKTKF